MSRLAKPDTIYDRAKQMLMMENDRPHVLREMIYVLPAGRHDLDPWRL